MILLITKDLFFVPPLKSAAEQVGVQLTTVLSADSTKLDALPAGDVTACVVDLSHVKVDQVAALFSSLRQRFPVARQVAFGPHVQIARLEAAQAAGADQVLSRGQLSSQIGRLVQDWLVKRDEA